jgi:addiction module HigA family antidote
MAIARTRPLAEPVQHPGEVLKDELEARGLSAHALALRLPASRVSQIVRGQRAVTPETALRLARYFGGSAAIWLRLQVAYDLARAEAALSKKIAAEVTPAARLIQERAMRTQRVVSQLDKLSFVGFVPLRPTEIHVFHFGAGGSGFPRVESACSPVRPPRTPTCS